MHSMNSNNRVGIACACLLLSAEAVPGVLTT